MKNKLLFFKLVTLALSALLTFLVLAIPLCHRFKKLSSYIPNARQIPRVRALSKSIYVFDRDFGYRYAPNSQVNATEIGIDKPLFCWKATVNQEGNIGKAPASWSSNDFKILVTGDSFTANSIGPVGGITWTDHLVDALPQFSKKNVVVKNYGREGYGILQMVHLAASIDKNISPDLIIIAFISPDIFRPRTWRKTVTIREETRVLVMYSPDDEATPVKAIEGVVINPLVAEGLCDPNNLDRQKDIGNIQAQFARYQTEHKTLGKNISSTALTPEDLLMDGEFRKDLNVLSKRGNKVVWIHLPLHGELSRGSYASLPSEAEVFSYIEETTKTKIIKALKYAPKESNYDQYFLQPFDGHPNDEGARLLAKMIGAALLDPANGF